jgi:hypothetical protein
MTEQRMPRIDHLVYATPDLDRGIDKIEKLLGVRATPGGQHPGRGTRNALVALRREVYLEIIGPDPEQPKPTQPRWAGLDNLAAPRLATWVARSDDLEQLVSAARQHGVQLGQVMAGSRRRQDGTPISWRFTDPSTVVADGIVPFFIDWGTTPHPARSAAPGATLVDLRAEHPDPESVRKILRHLRLDLPVQEGPSPALIARVEGGNGLVELR